MIELERLRAFVTVARTQNVTRAAELLHVSQSPLSRQILALEDGLGVALFTRERKRLRLTRAGRAFLADAEGLLRAAESVEQRARAWAKGEAGHLTIGYVAGAIYAGVLVTALERLRRRAPRATLELRPMRSHEQIHAHARLRCLIKQSNHLRIDQRIHLKNKMSAAVLLVMSNLPLDQLP